MSTSADAEFGGFPGETLPFLADLRENNTREWFDANRGVYEGSVKQPAKAFADIVGGEIEGLSAAPHTAKVFRINRDIRFSKNKTPYNAHVHVSWTAQTGGESPPSFMFGLSPEYCTVGCGVFEFSRSALESYRRQIAGSRGNDLDAILQGLKGQGWRLSEPDLKRLPAGFPQDHPHADLARHKGIAAWWDFAAPQDVTRPDIAGRCVERFREMLPLWRFIADIGM